ncbi:MAG: YegS/Rv2252/BmrU family lipid kinase [Bacteroidales bacterium]|jgi:YegS/Rv2252/BmrU family lipid kinase
MTVKKNHIKILFIVNLHSEEKKRSQLLQSIKKVIDAGKFLVEVAYTQYAGHAVKLSRQAVEDRVDIIVAAGGDGTINEVAGQMIDKEAVMGIIPMGSGNGLARHLGIPRHIEKAVRLINQYDYTRIDTCTINNAPFVSIAGVGFDALVAKHFARGERRGFMGYFTVVANHYLKYKPKKYHIEFANGQKLKTRALFIAFANSNQFGYNATIAPNARLTDGLLDVCVVKKPLLVSIPIIANLLLLRRIHLANNVNIIQTPYLSVTQSHNRVVNIDGEPVRMAKKLDVKIKPLSLRVIINKEDAKI